MKLSEALNNEYTYEIDDTVVFGNNEIAIVTNVTPEHIIGKTKFGIRMIWDKDGKNIESECYNMRHTYSELFVLDDEIHITAIIKDGIPFFRFVILNEDGDYSGFVSGEFDRVPDNCKLYLTDSGIVRTEWYKDVVLTVFVHDGRIGWRKDI